MSERRSSQLPVAIAATVVLLLFCLLLSAVWSAKVALVEQRVRQDYYADQNEERARRTIDGACTQSDRRAMIECIAEAVDAYRESQRSEQDLSAQENMARWALYMLAVSVTGLFVSAVGIFYIRATLEENRRAVEEAAASNRITRESIDVSERAARDANRPYVFCPRAQILWSIDDTLDVQVEIENSGVTPATFFTFLARIAIVKSEDVPWIKIPVNELPERTYGALSNSKPTTIVVTREFTSEEVTRVNSSNGKMMFVVMGQIRYGDIFGCEYESEFVLGSHEALFNERNKMFRTVGIRRTFARIKDADNS